METQKLMERTAIWAGVITAAGLVGFFFLFKAIGLVHNLELRALNIFVLGFGIVRALRYIKREAPRHFTYFNGLLLGIGTGAVAVVLFALFTLLYVTVLDPAFMTAIVENEPFSRFLNPATVTITIFFEGFFSGVLISYGTMQFLKHSHLAPAHRPAVQSVKPLGQRR